MPRPRTKRHAIVENAACLDLSAIRRTVLLVPGRKCAGTCDVVRHPSKQPIGFVSLSCDVTDEHRASVQLSFRVGRRGVEQALALTSVPRVPFGGQRWFFICPQTGARACRLYLPRYAERFLSREAHGLRYLVEHHSPMDNDIEKVCHLYRRITGAPPPQGALSPLPFRPKGMHDRTFSRLLLQLIIARGRALSHAEAWLDPQYRRD
jgi:hypothetical protein